MKNIILRSCTHIVMIFTSIVPKFKANASLVFVHSFDLNYRSSTEINFFTNFILNFTSGKFLQVHNLPQNYADVSDQHFWIWSRFTLLLNRVPLTNEKNSKKPKQSLARQFWKWDKLFGKRKLFLHTAYNIGLFYDLQYNLFVTNHYKAELVHLKCC